MEDGIEHENIDAQQWNSLQEEDEVDPGKEDSNWSQLPLPASGAPAVGTKMAYKDERQKIRQNFNIILNIQEIMKVWHHTLDKLHE